MLLNYCRILPVTKSINIATKNQDTNFELCKIKIYNHVPLCFKQASCMSVRVRQNLVNGKTNLY